MKILRTNLQDYQVINDEEEDAFNEEIQDEISNDINKPINTYGLIDEIKSILYTNLMKYYSTIITEVLIFSILDPRFKSLNFASLAQNQILNSICKSYLSKKKEVKKKYLIHLTYLIYLVIHLIHLIYLVYLKDQKEKL